MCGNERNMNKWANFATLGAPRGCRIKNQNKGTVKILNRDSHCPYLLSGETTTKTTIQYFKIHKEINNIPSILQTIQHTPMSWCTYLQFKKNTAMCLQVTVRKPNVMDKQGCIISHPRPSKLNIKHMNVVKRNQIYVENRYFQESMSILFYSIYILYMYHTTLCIIYVQLEW